MRSLLLVGRRDNHTEEVTQRVHGDVGLGAVLLLMAVKARSLSAFGRALNGASVEDHGRRIRSAAFGFSQQTAKIVNALLEQFGSQPTLGLLIDGGPGRQVVRHHPPLSSTAHDPPEAVEDLTKGILSLRSVFFHQSEIRNDKGSFFVADVAGIGFPCQSFICFCHTSSLSLHLPNVHNRL